MKKRLAVLAAMGTLAAFSLGAEAKTYAVEDEDGNTKYITVYDGKVETTTEEDEEIKTEDSDLYDWEAGEAVDDGTLDAYAVRWRQLQPEKFWRRLLSRILRRPTKSKKSSLSAMFAKSEAEGSGLYGGIIEITCRYRRFSGNPPTWFLLC